MLLAGAPVADFILNTITQKKKLPVQFAILQVGDNESSNVYINRKIKIAKELGFSCLHHRFDQTVPFEQLKNFIERLNQDPNIHGMIIQMPLPSHLRGIVDFIDHKKDIDGLGVIQQGKLFLDHDDCLLPCTPKGIIEIFKYYKITLEGRRIAVLGRSNLVGKPLAMLLLKEDAQVTIMHSKSENLESSLKDFDIICLCMGRPGFVQPEWLAAHQIVIDVGITKIDGKLHGDLNQRAYGKISAYTPVPGGVGLVTVACLMANVLKASRTQ
jgi:methylenetetrahydrofolate dehydrogenase (NADP+)/methenyltetrahydrofolate cyclohydrolase